VRGCGVSPTLIADEREYEIQASTWDHWKRFAEPFESPDEVLVRLFKSASRTGGSDGAGAARQIATATPTRKSGSKAHKGRARAASHLLLPESEYERPILQALQQAGGRAPAREVIEAVGGILNDRLTETDKETMSNGRALRWQNRAQFARLRLVKQGFLKSDSPRGVWEISRAGEVRLTEVA
jgi:hypothetical protein